VGILDNAKEVAKAVQEIHNLELYQRVLSLHSDIIEIVEENNKLREENKDLARTIALKQAMTFRQPFWYQEGDETPFCPACWESQNKTCHVVFAFDNEECTRWDCPTCKQMYLIKKTTGHIPRRQLSGGGPWS
jgi:hypothetical protein